MNCVCNLDMLPAAPGCGCRARRTQCVCGPLHSCALLLWATCFSIRWPIWKHHCVMSRSCLHSQEIGQTTLTVHASITHNCDIELMSVLSVWKIARLSKSAAAWQVVLSLPLWWRLASSWCSDQASSWDATFKLPTNFPEIAALTQTHGQIWQSHHGTGPLPNIQAQS